MPNDRGIGALLITTDYPPDIGGLQTYSYRIARDLPGGILSHVLAGSLQERDALPPPAPGIGLTMRAGRSRWKAFWWSLWSVPYFRFFKGTGLLLHMQWTTAIPSWLMRGAGLGIPYIVLIHGAELIDPNRVILGRLKKRILSNADAVVAGSRHTAEIIAQLGIRCRRLEVIHYGNPLEDVPMPDRPGSAASTSSTNVTRPPRLLCMHRLVPRKGTALLLDALGRLTHLPWTLDIVGRGEEEAALRERAHSLGLDERVRFHPPVDDAGKLKLLREASLFILPSLPPAGNNHVEGLGLTLLEAQSQGLPVLAARTGGIPEAVQEGLTGALFRAGDAEDLSEKLAALLRSPETLSKLGEAGPDWVRSHFSWKDGLGRLAALLRELAGR
jgi:phosphatidylinositol alpha-1,6-mannosyltransferase